MSLMASMPTGLEGEREAFAPDPGWRYLNRELSDIDFVGRVLEMAEDSQVPPLERLNFLMITEMLLDEFYRIRITALRTLIRNEDPRLTPDGMSAAENLAVIDPATNSLMSRQGDCWALIRDALAAEDVEIIDSSELTAADVAWIEDKFSSDLAAQLEPIYGHDDGVFPQLNDGQTYLVAALESPDGQERIGLVPLPEKLPRFFDVLDDRRRFITTETILKSCMGAIFDQDSVSAYGLARVLREGNLRRSSDSDDLPQLVEKALEQRSHADVIRLNVNRGMPEALRRRLYEALEIAETRQGLGMAAQDEDVATSEFVAVDGLIGLAGAQDILDALKKSQRKLLAYEKFHPDADSDGLLAGDDIFESIRQRDRLLHFPFDAFGGVIEFLKQAATDPDVLSIHQTLYRVGARSPVTNCLREAAKNGKSVTAVIELEARDDEKANLKLAKRLKKAGVTVHYGFLDKKVHAKAIAVRRREDGGERCYVNIATGNFHKGNAKAYTDLSLFTCDPAMGRDVASLFNYILTGTEPDKMEQLAMAPLALRQRLSALIAAEAEHARAGRTGEIWLKMNKLTDKRLIGALYRAADAGVDIQIVIRGICCLDPSVVSGSGQIRIKSVVGRFLEHSRIFCFGGGKPISAVTAEVFLSSVDWMPHKLDRRVELLAPVGNENLRRRILDDIMRAYLDDQSQSWRLDGAGSWSRIKPTDPGLYKLLNSGGKQ